MAALLAHRGPDDEGATALDAGDGLTLALAHRRLSIIDLSSAGHQPMSLDGGRLVLVYNGETYNYVELRAELEAKGRRFVTRTDTEVLLHAYDVWGDSFIERLNGMWSFALWDARRRRLLCAVDQSGIKPFFWTEAGGIFAFASEPKALLALPSAPRRVNGPRAVLFLLSLVDQVDAETLFHGVHRLLPGHALAIEGRSRPAIWRWWHPKRIEPPRTMSDADAQFRELLRDSIRIRFRADVPVGINLSGGLDSTGLVCTAADMAARGELSLPHGLRTFTATTRDPEINEGPVASSVAKLCGATSFTVEPTGDALSGDDLAKLVMHQDEPFGNLSTYMQFCVARRVRESGTVVVLSGQGPDELFSGYSWHYPYVWRDLFARGRLLAAGREVFSALRHGTVSGPSLLGYAAYAWAPSVRRRRYVGRIGGFLSSDAPMDGGLELLERTFKRADGRREFEREVETTGLPALLRYEDRNSMTFSIESRLPYLDPRIIDLAYSLPSWMKIRSGWSKAVLRGALEGVVPREVLWSRRKLGFAAPQGEFMSALVPAVRDVFSGPGVRSRALVDPRAVLGATEKPELVPMLWRFLNLELWMRQFSLAG
jgi:asparagine synthase (glutamine-hydrolysing)